MNIEWLTTFLGWCSVVNIAGLALTTLALMFMRDTISGIHRKMMGVGKADMLVLYVQYLSNYKIAVIMLNLVPYIALKIMAS